MHEHQGIPSAPSKFVASLQTALATTAMIAGIGLSPMAQAVDVDAGDYTAMPSGTNLGLVYYQYATRNALYSDGNKRSMNARLDSNVGILRGVHFMDAGGYIIDPQFLLPFGSVTAKNDVSGLGSSHGVGDLILASTIWLVNQPKTDTYFGITPFLFVPTGEYDKNQAVNLGENRWKLALQAGYITGLTDKLSLDLVGDVTLYGKNKDFGPSSATMKQDALYQAQGFLRYKIQPTWDVRFGISHSQGGETTVNNVAQHDTTRTTKATFGTAWFISPATQLMANYGRDISVENGFKEQDRLNLRLLSVF